MLGTSVILLCSLNFGLDNMCYVYLHWSVAVALFSSVPLEQCQVFSHPIIPCTERVISFLLRMVALRECPLLLAGNEWTSCRPHWDGTAAPPHQSPAAWPTSHCLFRKNLYRRTNETIDWFKLYVLSLLLPILNKEASFQRDDESLMSGLI